jgi:hypothetical protein
MIMADVLKIVFLVLGTLIVIVSYWLAAAALFPRLVERAHAVYDARPIRATLVGAFIAVPMVVVGLGMLGAVANPLLKMAGVVLIAIPALLGLVGSAGLGDRIGVGLPSADDAAHPWRRLLRGGTVLSITFLLPVVGWVGVLPWTLVSGVGAAVLAMRVREQQPAVITA